MAEFTFDNLHDFGVQYRRDTRSRQTRVEHTVGATARRVRAFVMRETAPVAFGDIRDHISVVLAQRGTASVVASSAHAAAVENGSKPHMPPIESLIAWVKLRGMQGLTSQGRILRSSKDWRMDPAKRIAKQLRGMQSGKALSVDAPTQLAWAIARAISKKGTKAQPFMKRAIPYAISELDRLVKIAIVDRPGSSDGEAPVAIPAAAE